MYVIALLITFVIILKIFPVFFAKAELFVAAFKQAHREIEEEAKIYGEQAYSVNFYSPYQNRR